MISTSKQRQLLLSFLLIKSILTSHYFVFGCQQGSKRLYPNHNFTFNRQQRTGCESSGFSCSSSCASAFVLRDTTIRYPSTINSPSWSSKQQSYFHPKQKQRHHHHSSTHLQMKIKIGLVGLPNVGKSTLFNVLAQRSLAKAENFPFCTVDPNTAPLPIPDAQQLLPKLGQFANSKRVVPATLDWVDVAGLVQNAHRGEGLGNRFLATVRECDAVCHVVRMFEDDGSASSADGNVIHVNGRVDPREDAEIVNLELILADEAHVRRRLEKSNVPEEERVVLEKVLEGLSQGLPARSVGLTKVEMKSIKSMGLLTLKPVLYAFNVDEIDFILGRKEVEDAATRIFQSIEYTDFERDTMAIVSAKLEAELYGMIDGENDEEENQRLQRMEYLSSLGMEFDNDGENNDETIDNMLSHTILPSVITKMLNLSIAYTGPGVPPERSRTTRAHLFCNSNGDDNDDDGADDLSASGLAGRIHGDIQRGFIRAEVTPASELLQHDNYAAAKEAGCVRTEGREYVLQADDVVLIKWK